MLLLQKQLHHRSGLMGLFPIGNRPFLLPVRYEEEESNRGDDKVNKEDHEQPAHDIPEV
jgi:hypothetical protein